MCFMYSAQRQVELRRLSNQIPVLCKANSLCDVANDIVTTYKQGHQWFWNCVFRNTRAPFDRVMCIFVKCCVFCLLFYKVGPLVVRKNTNSSFLRFFVRSVALFRSLRLTPMYYVRNWKVQFVTSNTTHWHTYLPTPTHMHSCTHLYKIIHNNDSKGCALTL